MKFISVIIICLVGVVKESPFDSSTNIGGTLPDAVKLNLDFYFILGLNLDTLTLEDR